VPDPTVLALVGPTAAGKSAVAMAAAERLGPDRVEIVAVDAFTVYRGMDVGTAKPSAADRARVRHRCIDLLDPDQECTAEWFQGAARAAIADVLARGRTPLLVGGSGLYFRTVVDPLAFPPTDPAVRAAVEQRVGGDAAVAHAELVRRDPEAAARMEPGNLRRAVRALEVLDLTGRPFSAWRRGWDAHRSVYPGLRVVGLDVPRQALVARIDARVEAMVADGLVDECRALRRRFPTWSRSARQAIGYAEALDHLDGAVPLAEAVERTKVRTRRFAGRQVRWFAADPRVDWCAPPEAADALVAAADPLHGGSPPA
jgi:tRNA dimethylallyltransferase